MKTGIPILSLLAVSSSLCLAELASPSEELIVPLSPGMVDGVECDLYFQPRTEVSSPPEDLDFVDAEQPRGSLFAAIG